MTEQFDMSSEQAARDHVVTRRTSKSTEPDKHAISMSEVDMVRHLSDTARYRILQKLVPRAISALSRPEYSLTGIILDTETTGLNARKNEIGVIAFTFDAKGNIGDVTGVYGGLQQPSVSIPSDITRLTGITDEMVAGHSIDITICKPLGWLSADLVPLEPRLKQKGARRLGGALQHSHPKKTGE
ncbi:exonuclease [Rhizobium sp. PP-WC-1G-195]|nr:exonuclease [Rhizobium sp. PP-WC-1G-195]